MARSTDTRDALAVAIQADLPVLLWGPPGEGKTAMLQGIGTDLGLAVEVVVGSIRDSTDFGGLPVRNGTGVDLVPPSWAVRAAHAGADGPGALVVLDELTTCHPSVQAAMLRVVFERAVGDLALPPGVAIAAAANPPEVAADGFDLAAPLANRFCHLDWLAELTTWTEGLIGGWRCAAVPRLPESWAAHRALWRGRVAGLLTARRQLLRQMPDDDWSRGRAWASPRTWDLACRAGAAAEAANAGADVALELIAGLVGEGPALELMAWIDDADLPDPEEVLADPSLVPVDGRGDQVLAVLGSMVAAVADHPTEARWCQAWEVLRVATPRRVDVAAVSARALLGCRAPTWELPEGVEVFAPVLSQAGLL